MAAGLALGTAQFGLDYGITNSRGRIPLNEVLDILSEARTSSVGYVDTAAAYGDAEQVLGQCGVDGFRIITKVPPLDSLQAASVRKAVTDSCRLSRDRIGCAQLDGLLLHSAADLLGPMGEEIWSGLLDAKDAGLTRRVGVSVYDADQVEAILARQPIDMIQLPLSVLNQNLASSIGRLSDCGVAVFVRSIFLQGVLLSAVNRLPKHLAGLAQAVERFQMRARDGGLTALEAAIAFVRDMPGVEGVVVGTASLDEFRAIIAAFQRQSTFDASDLDAHTLKLIDPRSWTAA